MKREKEREVGFIKPAMSEYISYKSYKEPTQNLPPHIHIYHKTYHTIT